MRRVLRSYGSHPVFCFTKRWTVKARTFEERMRLFDELLNVDVVFIEGRGMGPGDQFGMAQVGGNLHGPFLAGGNIGGMIRVRLEPGMSGSE